MTKWISFFRLLIWWITKIELLPCIPGIYLIMVYVCGTGEKSATWLVQGENGWMLSPCPPFPWPQPQVERGRDFTFWVQGEGGRRGSTYSLLSLVQDWDQDGDRHVSSGFLAWTERGRVLGKRLLSFLATLFYLPRPDRSSFSFCLFVPTGVFMLQASLISRLDIWRSTKQNQPGNFLPSLSSSSKVPSKSAFFSLP